MRRLSILLSVITVVGWFCTGSPLHAVTELRFGHAQPPTSTLNMACLEFKKAVETATKGEIVINVHPGGALGGNQEMVQGVRIGSIDLTANGNGFYTTFAPKNNVLDLPYLFTNYDHVTTVLDGPLGQSLLDELAKYNIKALTFLDQGFRHVTNSLRPIRVPEDLKGLKIRVAPNKAHVMAFQLLGANPVSMSFTEVYMAMQTKTVDAQENPTQIIISNRFQEVQKYMSLTRHAYTAGVLAMNLRKFNSLPTAQQAVLLDAARTMARNLREEHRRLESDQLAKLREGGMQIVENLDVVPFQRIVAEKTQAEYVQSFGSDLLNRIVQADKK